MSSVARSSANRVQLIPCVQKLIFCQLFDFGHREPAQLDQLVVIPVELVDVGFGGVHHMGGALVIKPTDGDQIANVVIQLFEQFATDSRLRLLSPFDTTAWKSPAPWGLAPEAGMHGEQKLTVTMENTAGSLVSGDQGITGC